MPFSKLSQGTLLTETLEANEEMGSSDLEVQVPDTSTKQRRLGYLGVALFMVSFVSVVFFSMARSRQSATSKNPGQEQVELFHTHCDTATEGSACYRDVDFAMNKHIEEHPDWYVGLTKKSSFEEFQEFLHKQKTEEGNSRCPRPCHLEEAKKRTAKKISQGVSKNCHTSRGGEECFSHVKYTKRQIPRHPDWYPGLTQASTLLEVQNFLSMQLNGDGEPVCPKPCDFHLTVIVKKKNQEMEGKCRDAVAGEQCHIQVKETMARIPKHPDEYPGLSANSTFKEVQFYMHEERDSEGARVCPKPCGMDDHDKKPDDDKDEEEKDCHSAGPGESCYNDILYAEKEVERHPEWYAGLTRNNSFLEFQAFLHSQVTNDKMSKKCPKPCSKEAVENITKLMKTHGTSCFTAQEGTECYKSVVWVATEGYIKHPDWYAGISQKSSFEEVQNRLSKDENSKCDHMACPCKTADPDSECGKSVIWVINAGFKKHPKWYPGLSNTSSFEAVQARLHEDVGSSCSLPCAPLAWPYPGPIAV